MNLPRLRERVGELLFVVVARVAPAEMDFPVSKRDQAMVGDGHAMRVAA